MTNFAPSYSELLRPSLLWYVLLQVLPGFHSNVNTLRKSILHATFVPNITFFQSNRSMVVEVPNYVLRLRLRQMALELKYAYFGGDGREQTERGIPNCFFIGIVDEFPDWIASLSTCDGLEGSFGLMGDSNNYYYIEPKDKYKVTDRKIGLDEEHILYSEHLEDLLEKETYYGVCDSTLPIPERFEVASSIIIEPFEIAESKRVKRVVELVMINDNKLYTNHNSKLDPVVQRDLQIVDYMNQLFKAFNVTIVLNGIIVWNGMDRIEYPRNNDATQILKSFQDYIEQNSPSVVYDAILMITGRDFLGSIVGLAFKASSCYAKYSVGVVQDTKTGVAYVGATASHELGHILGMSHDDDFTRVCECRDITGKCIMAGLSLAIPATTWSNCSGSDMFQSFKQFKLTEECLHNVPAMTNSSDIPVFADGEFQS